MKGDPVSQSVSCSGGHLRLDVADGGQGPQHQVDPEGNPEEEIVMHRKGMEVRSQADYRRGWEQEGMTSGLWCGGGGVVGDLGAGWGVGGNGENVGTPMG